MRFSHITSKRKGLLNISVSVVSLLITATCSFSPCSTYAENKDDVVILRVCNWEEYIDEGGWDEDSAIELDDGNNTVIGNNSMIEDFEEWYYDTYNQRIKVEYSTFGTNEELYNQLNLGDVYDVVCPSEYMIMKLMVDDEVEPFDKSFFDTSIEYNYYAKGVSPYIRSRFEENEIDGKIWADYAAGYMWGITGIVYNPKYVSRQEASTWEILRNPKLKSRVSIKDNVRDSFFAAMGIYKKDLLTSKSFIDDDYYHFNLMNEMNDVSKDSVKEVEKILKDMKENAYSFETDSGKADMVTGKIYANYQWSGDAVYSLDQADEEGLYLEFAVPQESTNIWFDGWTMLKKGLEQDSRKKAVAQAFINFLSRPDNAVRNMNYIGYTSAIAGGDDSTIFDYAKYNYEAADDEEDAIEYDIGYFFTDDKDCKDYIINAAKDAYKRQLFSQYPTEEVMKRASIMTYFGDEANADINQMWINVRCYDLKNVPFAVWIVLGIGLIICAAVVFRRINK